MVPSSKKRQIILKPDVTYPLSGEVFEPAEQYKYSLGSQLQCYKKKILKFRTRKAQWKYGQYISIFAFCYCKFILEVIRSQEHQKWARYVEWVNCLILIHENHMQMLHLRPNFRYCVPNLIWSWFESGWLEILTVISKYPDLCPLFTSSCLGKLQAGPGTREWRRWRRSCRWGRWQGRCGGSPLAPSRPSGAPPPWRWWRWLWRSPPHKRFDLILVFSNLCCF